MGVFRVQGCGFWGYWASGYSVSGSGAGIAVFVYVCRAWRAKSDYSLGETNGFVSQPIGLRLRGLGFSVQARGL